MNKRVFLIHGWEGNSENHWFPWLNKELESRDFGVNALTMPNPAYPKVGDWLAHITEMVGIPDKNTYFVGHSLGCISVVRYLAELSADVKVGGCVFVAGFSGRLNIKEIRACLKTLTLKLNRRRLLTDTFRAAIPQNSVKNGSSSVRAPRCTSLIFTIFSSNFAELPSR